MGRVLALHSDDMDSIPASHKVPRVISECRMRSKPLTLWDVALPQNKNKRKTRAIVQFIGLLPCMWPSICSNPAPPGLIPKHRAKNML